LWLHEEGKKHQNINRAKRKKYNEISTQHRGKNTTKYQHSTEEKIQPNINTAKREKQPN
jgi:DNA uptake protein ComE-like DNA-binding protein